MNDAPSLALRLTRGTADDLPDVVEVMRAAFEECFGEGWTRSQCAGILPMPGVRLVLVRLADGVVAGFSLDRTVVEDAELLLLAVAPKYRRRGIGRTLLKDFIDRSRKAGVRTVHLEVRDGNSAVEMYRQEGFTCVGRRRNYYRGNDGLLFDALTFRKPLDADSLLET